MNRFVTILLVLAAAAAAVFLFVFEPRLTSTREEEATRGFVMNFDPMAIAEIRVQSGDGGFELSRRDNAWWVGPKPKDSASPQMVYELLKAASELQVFDIIRAGQLGAGRDLDDYGLDKPKSQIEFRGDGARTLYFGKEAAGDGRVYVRRSDSNDIFIVSDELQRLAFRNPQDFRDRRLTYLVPNSIDKFTIKRGAGELALERGGHGWEIVRPLHARADDALVDKLLKDLLGLQIVEFVADEANDLSSYGLGEPRAELILTADGEPRPLALRIGADASDKTVLAQFTARDSVYHLPGQAWTLLQAGPADLRDRRVAELNLDTVDAIRLDNGAKQVAIERAGESWKSDGREVAEEAVERLAQAVTAARVVDYLPLTDANLSRTGLDKPAGKIVFEAWLSENTPETTAGRRPILAISIGQRDGDRVAVRVNDDPEICVIPAALLDAIPATLPRK